MNQIKATWLTEREGIVYDPAVWGDDWEEIQTFLTQCREAEERASTEAGLRLVAQMGKDVSLEHAQWLRENVLDELNDMQSVLELVTVQQSDALNALRQQQIFDREQLQKRLVEVEDKLAVLVMCCGKQP